ncbi:hypothetical protein HCN44_010111 [Aphidius gifuensis]|uniref:Mitochondrial uncoupling protein n=1 Tax=Aphidius gifuensis TaxID=684658 RepID=A0A834XWS6_APHGI|nr:mitochondrial uncoupling protein 2-like [Aphidius gifuensis]KAF7993516.1 hypothetical protein HCN44_010111 [Aphidius gifuensis]
MKMEVQNDISLGKKLLTAGTAACIADLATFPLDTAKVRMQIAGEGLVVLASVGGPQLSFKTPQPGLFQTITNIVRLEGAKSLYGGLSAGLQRQMCFASVRIGLYDTVKVFYTDIVEGKKKSLSGAMNFGVCIAAGITTGALAVVFAQPTDVVKVRLQAGNLGKNSTRYHSTFDAYKSIAMKEGVSGLWKGTAPNISRNAIVNVSEIVCYDMVKQSILNTGLLNDGIPCHFSAALGAGLCTTIVASPVDVVKTRFMNSGPGEYKGAIDVAEKMLFQEGFMSFYKGFIPSFSRLVSWNIVLWLTYEQLKILVQTKTVSTNRY